MGKHLENILVIVIVRNI